MNALGDDVVAAYGDTSFALSGIANDHRKVVPGGLFVCIKGYVSDGHDFADGALANGAAALVAEKPPSALGLEGVEPDKINGARVFLHVRDTRRALAVASHLFYGSPTKKLALAGVTGTKGKTTTVYMIRSILQAAGINAGMIGTVENDLGGEIFVAKETTPDSVELAGHFAKMAERGCSHAVMEVSSQGLALSRVECCDFDIGVFTNFYRDHISPFEHASIEDYFAAKLHLFSMCRRAVINGDIAECVAVADAFAKHDRREGAPLIYSADAASANHGTAAVRASRIGLARGGKASASFYVETPWFSGDMEVGLPGRYNVSNALAAISVCGMLGISEEAMREGLRRVRVRGRTEAVDEGQKFTVLVDYAHNAASLEALLTMLHEYDYTSVTTVFGCGGNRSKDRRYDMGEVSGRLSSLTVVTSDNPRQEEPAAIVADIEKGLRRTDGRYIICLDRKEAIGRAIGDAPEGGLVLIAGKGHETTQTFADRKVPFDDVEVAREFLRTLSAGH
ncbi:MAG: UDP-N-acetylmuramoyl-L-alanyl-D-glutamate--2,6-diaminopimelate ligase [Oscillospiraceae bacterium]|nr:UDP-N-acetylmuramoyl-L-alanyl-D-glutamate--2,6-diaminopimelate ligase [Oscillospiraceae bacterium]